MKGKSRWAVNLAVLVLASAGAAQVASADAVTETTEHPQVQVMGKRLYRRRQDIIKTEDKFFALFNELNKDDDYDVHCGNEARTGTRLKQRVCRVHYYEKAQADEARAFLTGDYAPPADMIALERGPEYEKKALAVINAHPELRKLIRERDALEKKYNATRKERFKGRWILFE
jgi:hypothetical protein